MNILIIGAGAAGMFAACIAAENGGNVTIIERNDRAGWKLGITGKGRCNLTNACSREEFFENIPTNPRFMYSSFAAFDNWAVMDYFENTLGVPLKTERGNRVFPVSDKAGDIVKALEQRCNELNVRIVTDLAKKIIIRDGAAVGVKCKGGEYFADRVIIAAGGESYPRTGSDGSGVRMAAAAGHKIIPPRPSLVPLEIKEGWCAEAMGLSLRNVRLTLLENGKNIHSEQGEMLFTHFGVSGPLVLTASAHMRKSAEYALSIDLKPALDEATLDRRIQRDFSELSNRDISNALVKLLPSSLIAPIVKLSGISANTKANGVTREQRHALVQLIKAVPLTVKGFRPIAEAIITAGGVDTKEIDPKTMQSKLVPNLYFAGEVIDVDAYTGGFNLQIAWSTAHAAAAL